MEIYSFTLKNTQIDMTFKKGFVAYTFEKDGKTYGQKVKVPSRGVMDILSTASLLIINAYESIEALEK